MAFYCYEITGSRQWTYDGGKVTTTRTFKIYDDTAANLDTPAEVRAKFGVAVGGTHAGPDALPTFGELFPGETGVWARSYQLTREPNTDIWQVVWTYSNAQVTAGVAQPGEPGFVEWTLDIAASFVDTFITSPTYPANGNVGSTPAAQKITGGTQIDLNGTPLSRLRYTSELVINETIQSVSGIPSIVSQMTAARGSRNSVLWEGIPVGRALYTGGQIRRAGVSLYTVTHRIIDDSEYHLLQVPERDTAGRVPTDEINGAQRARNVYWRQPFPNLYPFASISTNW
jgi:hypothetical protein